MDKLSDRELTLIRRAAEDAIEAWNRNHKPFVDVVSHPLKICTLVDMAKLSLTQQKRIDDLEKRLHNIYMNAESNSCDSCKYAEAEAMAVGCGF